MNPPGPPFNLHNFLTHLWSLIITQSWPWWAAGAGIGLTALALAWFTGARLGVTGGYTQALSKAGLEKSDEPSSWKFFFILGIPLGAFLANLGHWSWTWTYGRLDAVTFGSLTFKLIWLLVGGFLVGYGARWAGGCVSGNSIMGVPLGNKMAIVATLGFLAAGIVVTNLIFGFLRIP